MLTDALEYPLAGQFNDRNVPFALLTGFNADDLPAKLGLGTVLTKPLNPQNLRDSLARVDLGASKPTSSDSVSEPTSDCGNWHCGRMRRYSGIGPSTADGLLALEEAPAAVCLSDRLVAVAGELLGFRGPHPRPAPAGFG